jgi:dipeptidyl aminopeptidase/acylaminoacyl peptidase
VHYNSLLAQLVIYCLALSLSFGVFIVSPHNHNHQLPAQPVQINTAISMSRTHITCIRIIVIIGAIVLSMPYSRASSASGATGSILYSNYSTVPLSLYLTSVDNPKPIRLGAGNGSFSRATWLADSKSLVNDDGRVFTLEDDKLTYNRTLHIFHNPAGLFATKVALSPDETKIAFVFDREINTMNVDGTNRKNLTRNVVNDSNPVWSPDGTQILFTSTRAELWNLFVMNASGGGLKELAHTKSETPLDSFVWSPDGSKVGYFLDRTFTIINVADQSVVAKFENVNRGAAWSPVGEWLALSMWISDNESRIFVMKEDGSEKQQVSAGPDEDKYPLWQPSPDGR